jgi:hypothetical protein
MTAAILAVELWVYIEFTTLLSFQTREYLSRALASPIVRVALSLIIGRARYCTLKKQGIAFECRAYARYFAGKEKDCTAILHIIE